MIKPDVATELERVNEKLADYMTEDHNILIDKLDLLIKMMKRNENDKEKRGKRYDEKNDREKLEEDISNQIVFLYSKSIILKKDYQRTIERIIEVIGADFKDIGSFNEYRN